MEPQPKHSSLLPNSPAFVLGNGRSRLSIAPNGLMTAGTVYGCNAQYREFEPHYLIAVDVKMVNEIIASGYNRTHEVWTNPNKGITSKAHINFFSPHKGWSSGPTALWLAATNNHQDIYILGFDYQGTEQGLFNNVYADTFNYKKSTDAATYFGNWLSQTEKVIKEFRHTRFYRVVAENTFLPPQLANIPNLTTMSVEEFHNKFPQTIYSDQTNQKTTI